MISIKIRASEEYTQVIYGVEVDWRRSEDPVSRRNHRILGESWGCRAPKALSGHGWTTAPMELHRTCPKTPDVCSVSSPNCLSCAWDTGGEGCPSMRHDVDWVSATDVG
jgi:hypothetical protein